MKTIIVILILLSTISCTNQRMTCMVYKDTYNNRRNFNEHWMNEKFNTNIIHYDTRDYFTTRKRKK